MSEYRDRLLQWYRDIQLDLAKGVEPTAEVKTIGHLWSPSMTERFADEAAYKTPGEVPRKLGIGIRWIVYPGMVDLDTCMYVTKQGVISFVDAMLAALSEMDDQDLPGALYEAAIHHRAAMAFDDELWEISIMTGKREDPNEGISCPNCEPDDTDEVALTPIELERLEAQVAKRAQGLSLP